MPVEMVQQNQIGGDLYASMPGSQQGMAQGGMMTSPMNNYQQVPMQNGVVQMQGVVLQPVYNGQMMPNSQMIPNGQMMPNGQQMMQNGQQMSVAPGTRTSTTPVSYAPMQQNMISMQPSMISPNIISPPSMAPMQASSANNLYASREGGYHATQSPPTSGNNLYASKEGGYHPKKEEHQQYAQAPMQQFIMQPHWQHPQMQMLQTQQQPQMQQQQQQAPQIQPQVLQQRPMTQQRNNLLGWDRPGGVEKEMVQQRNSVGAPNQKRPPTKIGDRVSPQPQYGFVPVQMPQMMMPVQHMQQMPQMEYHAQDEPQPLQVQQVLSSPSVQRSQPPQMQSMAPSPPRQIYSPTQSQVYSSPSRATNMGLGTPRREIGLGLLLERNEKERGITVIKEVVSGLGASVTRQIFTEDILVEIDGQAVAYLDLATAKGLCRGQKGSVARLVIDRAGRRHNVEVPRILPSS